MTERALVLFKAELPDVPIGSSALLSIDIGPRVTSGVRMRKNLGGVFAYCQAHDAQACELELADSVQRTAQQFRESGKPPTANSVRLLLRTGLDVRRMPLLDLSPQPFLPGRPVGLSEFVVICAIKYFGPAVQPISCGQLQHFGLTPESAYEKGRANLARELRPLASVARPIPAGQVGEVDGDATESSRIILHEQFAELASAQGGTLVVAAPSAETLLYVSEDSPAALTLLATRARALMARVQQPLSDRMLKWTPSGWDIVR
ncbi:MAG TPA: hypothetical protein VF169_16620 [Albitalea sp.]|uniref:hypothetical protein n=1 Tax=Piscinibacter sp. TaxID=1903157 RepID=UPI002ED4021C